jgi:hypothetical protein
MTTPVWLAFAFCQNRRCPQWGLICTTAAREVAGVKVPPRERCDACGDLMYVKVSGLREAHSP